MIPRLAAGVFLCLPNLAQAAQQCALPAASPGFTLAENTVSPDVQQRPAPPPVATSSSLPFWNKVAGAGAQVLDFGMVHGLHLIGARSGQEFRVFSMLPDGSAAVEGAPLAMSVDQLTQLAASEITQLSRVAGFDGLFVRSGNQFQVFYVSPDGQAVVPGILRDAEGRNLTRAQVQSIPGAIPTVELQSGQSVGPGIQPNTSPEPSLAAVQKASVGSVGPNSAPEVFMIVDPQCIYSVRAFQQLQPYAASGKIKLSLVPVAILDHEDQGRSTRSALALLSKGPAEIPSAWQRGETNNAPSAEAQERLAANMAIATSIGLQGTPTLVWRGYDGKAMRIDGVPTDIAALLASAGG